MCTHADHAALKSDPARVQAETVFVAAQYINGELLGDLRNCVKCGSTILAQGETGVSGASGETPASARTE